MQDTSIFSATIGAMKDAPLTISTKTLWQAAFVVALALAIWKVRNILLVILAAVVIASFVESITRDFHGLWR
jgi:uncharacterized membrane protein YraQ (UPF0718 family)